MIAQPDLTALESAATAGSSEHAFQLARALVAIERMEEALHWYLRAAQAGHTVAQIEYARMRLYGITDAPAPAIAVEWLERAEAAGHPIATDLLVQIALGGMILPRDRAINERLLQAVQADHPPALLTAAVHFGRKPHPDDQALCLHLLERAADKGNAIAAMLLAARLAHGEGCEARPDVAMGIHAQLDSAGFQRLPQFTLPPPGSIHAAPRQLALEDVLTPPRARTLSTQPRIAVIDQLLSADECRLLIASAQPLLRNSYTVDPQSGAALNTELRTSSDARFDPVLDTSALRLVQLRMAAAAGMELVNAEQLIVLRYAPGQEYRPHRDYLPVAAIERDGAQAGNRIRTICAYLNPVHAGGATDFPVPTLQVAPLPGRVVIFDNLKEDGAPEPDSLHAGTPVQAGEKWLATLWLRQRRYRDW